MKSDLLKKIVITTSLLCALSAAPALSEALPWQKGGGAQQPIVTRSAPPAVQAPVAAPESADQRTQDDRRLNVLASRFYKAKPHHKNIIGTLRVILKDVKAFHEELLQRSYNAVDIIRDTESLQMRVSRQLTTLQAKAATATTTK